MAEEETVRQDARLDPDKRDSPPSIRLPWLTPLAALVIGVLLAVLAISLLAKTSAEDPGHRCGSWGLPQLSLAGTVDRANEILDCIRHEGGDATARQTFIQEARTALRWDNVAIPAYVAAIALWCSYAALRARRRPTRHLAWSLAALAAAAGLADYGENLSVICGFLDADGPDGRAVDWAFAFSLARWIMLVPPTLLALGYLVSTFGQVMRRRQWDEPETEPPTLDPPPPPVTTLPSSELPPPLGEPLDPRRAARFAIPGEPGGSCESRVGIGLSGGGIRAAAFSLGALQAFGETTLYGQAEYLATVSGGGYVGGASQFLVHEAPTVAAPFAPGSPEVAWTARRARFLWWPATPRQRRRSTRMFVTGVGAGLLGIAFNLTLLVLLLFAVVRPFGWAVRTLLTHPGPTGESLDRSAVPGMWLTLVALAPLLVIVGSFLWRWVKRFHFRPAGLRVPVFILLLATLTLGPGIVIRYGLTTTRWWGHTGDVAHHVVGIVVLVALPVALALLMPPATANGVVGRLYPAVGWLLGLLAILLGAAWLEGALVHGATAHSSGRAFLIFVAVAAGLTTFVVITAFLRWLYHPRSALANDGSLVKPLPARTTASRASVIAAVALAVVGALGAVWRLRHEMERFNWSWPDWLIWLVVSVVLAAIYLLLDQKRWSPHPLYKARLASTFSPIRTTPPGSSGPDGWDVDRQWIGRLAVEQLNYREVTALSTYARPVKGHPKLLVCAATYATRGEDDGLAAFPFVFANDYVGGADVGWMRTPDFEHALGTRNGPDGSLQAAIAISGAAVSSGLGEINLGSLNAAIGVFNLRLGVWLPNPRYVNELSTYLRRETDQTAATPPVTVWRSSEGPALRWRTQRRFPYLFKEIAGVHDFDDRFVYVTDGGQMDNLGLLALLVRRCRLIIAVDASGDGAGTTNTFLQLVQVAYHRYGIRFSVDEASEPLPADPVPGRKPPPLTTLTAKMCLKVKEAEADDPKLAAAGRLFEAATARLLIHYPHVSDDMPATKGRLILAKAILTNGLEDELYAFARDDKAGKQFPKDSTADQFLTPVQFDAYRRLGHAIGTVASREAEIDLRS